MTATRTGVAARGARAVTEVLAPANVVVLSLLVVGVAGTPDWVAGVGWGLLAALFCAGIPMVVIVGGVRAGWWTDHHLVRREQRHRPLAAAVVSVVAGLLVLGLLGAPADLVALVVAMLAGLVVTMAVTTVWKVSVHTSVAAGTVIVLVVVAGPLLWLAAVVPAVVGWSRVVLGDHTVAQVCGGIVLGAAVSGTVFTLLT